MSEEQLDINALDADQFVVMAYNKRGGLQLMADRIKSSEARAAQLQAERDEMQREIMRLPKPPESMGDGPQERVSFALELLEDFKLLHGVAMRERDELARKLEQAQKMSRRAYDVIATFKSIAVLDEMDYFITAYQIENCEDEVEP